jgi:cytochrome c biogenesis protein CcmG, thiol:disulfide interchange protein DsbE
MNWKRASVALLATVPVIALFAYGLTRDPREIPSPLPGRDAPRFAMAVMPANTDEAPVTDTVRLADRRGRIVVMNFYASWCLACRDEHPVLQELAPEYRAKGVEFYGVLYKDSPNAIRRWISEMGGQPYPTLLDPGSRTAIDYGLYGVPETFFVGRDGRVARKHVGPVTREVLRHTLDSLIAASPAPGVGGDTARGLSPVGTRS